jgi:hypothetical protein
MSNMEVTVWKRRLFRRLFWDVLKAVMIMFGNDPTLFLSGDTHGMLSYKLWYSFYGAKMEDFDASTV